MFDKSKFNIEKVGGVANVTYEDKDIFRSNCPISKKEVKALNEYQQQYLEEAANVAASLAKENFKKDKELKQLVLEVPYAFKGKGSAKVSVTKEKEYRNFLGNGDEVIRKSAITLNVTDPAAKLTKSKIGELVDDLTATFCK